MSTEALEKYKKLYSDLVFHFTGVHNTHNAFVKHRGRETGYATRKHLAALVKIAQEMRRQGVAVYRENLSNQKLEKIRLKEEKKNKKKKRKNENNDMALSK